jgi:cell wall-associated NlpC family hydrolase
MQAGYACQRDTYMQEATLGQEIKEGFERGDLVFWKGHVGILQSSHQLLHANASFMQTVSEDFDNACQRIEETDGSITSIRRLSHSAIGV